MRRRNTTQTVSPIEQMFFLNRTSRPMTLGFNASSVTGTAAAADPDPFSKIALTVLSVFSRLFHIGGDPYRDVHIPAQNAATAAFGTILNQINAKRATGTLTGTDINYARSAIIKIDSDFLALTNQLAAQHPDSASRYRAGYNDIHNLEQTLLEGMTPEAFGVPPASVMDTARNLFTSPSGGISTTGIALLAAAVFVLPRLFSGSKKSQGMNFGL